MPGRSGYGDRCCACPNDDAAFLRERLPETGADRGATRNAYTRWYRESGRSLSAKDRAFNAVHGVRIVDRGTIPDVVAAAYEQHKRDR
ncbi:hypothetical protein GCM10027059_22420 [Myceligenerans halotolerans]